MDQHQALWLNRDPRFKLYHTDVPFFVPEWERLDAGFTPEARAILLGLQPPVELPVDRIYRVSWPLRVHAGPAERIFVFCTCEFGRLQPEAFCGPEGDERGVDFQAVELVTTSQWSKEGFLAMGFPPERVHTIPLGVDPALFTGDNSDSRRHIRANLNIADDAHIFLSVGNMMWNKGIGPLVAAFARHRLKNENAVLVLKGGDALYGARVGEGVAEAQKLGAPVSNPSVVSSIRYVPHNLPQKALAALYLASDVYVSPYRAEGFNLPVLEALAAGLPVLVTEGGPTEDFCPAAYCRKIASVRVSGPQGIHLEPSVDSIVEHMQRMSDEASALSASAVAGRQVIWDRYSWQAVARRLGDLLDA